MIDAHLHLWADDPRAYPWGPHDQVAVPTVRASWERLVAEMGTVGVAGAVAIQPRVYGYDHAYLRSVAAAGDDRVAAVCLVNPVRPGAPDELSELITKQGFRGLRLTAIGLGDAGWLVGPEAQPLWGRIRELRVPVSFLVEPWQLQVVARAAAMCEQVPIVVDHLGRCGPGDGDAHSALVNLARAPNVYVKVSAIDALSEELFPYRDLWPLMQRCFDAFGPDRLMWGTDFPHVLAYSPYGWSLDALDQAIRWESDRDRLAVTGGTAATIYGLEGLAGRQSGR